MRLASAAQMREIDRKAIEEIAIPAASLMEAAGAAVAREAEKMLGGACGRNIIALCGKGNNGGDGLVAARQLAGRGAKVLALLCCARAELSSAAQQQFAIAEKSGMKLRFVRNKEVLPALLVGADLVLDALLGTGSRGPAKGLIASAIEALNTSGQCVLAVDIPSGGDADSGALPGLTVRADRTLSLGLSKAGLFFSPLRECAGRVEVDPIGFPPSLIESPELFLRRFDGHAAASLLPARAPDSHKGNYGRVLVIAGSRGLAGAAALSAQAALLAGAGLVVAACPVSIQPVLAAKLTEAMTLGLPETEGGLAGKKAFKAIEEKLEWADVIAAGPGLGRAAGTGRFLELLLKHCDKPLVLDADALQLLAGPPRWLFHRKAPVILTPHPGEYQAFFKIQSQARGFALAHGFALAEEIRAHARKWGFVLHLKGAPSMTATPEGEVFVNSSGNPGMASGGCGDVLTGLVAALLGQGLPPGEAAVLGAYLHGAAGDEAAKLYGIPGVTAGRLLECLHKAFINLRMP